MYKEWVKERYPAQVLSDREHREVVVMTCILNDLTLLDDFLFKDTDFLSIETNILYRIATKLKAENYQTATLMDVKGRLLEDQKKYFAEHGIWSILNDSESIANKDSFTDYVDKLYKCNIYMKLTDLGIDIFKEIYYGEHKFTPFYAFKDMTSEQVKEFYESLINDFGTVNLDRGIEEVVIDFDDDYFETIFAGESAGTMFDVGGLDIIGNEITAFPTISKQSNGLIDTSFSILAGYSNVGKSTYLVAMVMALIYRGEKVVICSNEQKHKPFTDNFLMWILVNKLKYRNIDKNKIRAGKEALSEEDLRMLNTARDVWRKEYKDKVIFISLPSAKMDFVQKKFRDYYLKHGCSVFIYDTFKIDFSSKRENFWLSMIEDSRKLAEFANRYNTKVFATMQCALHTQGQLFLDSNVLSNSKQVKEILQNLFLIRDMYDEEKDSTSKFYCSPYTERYTKNDMTGWTRIEETYELDPNKNYKVIFLDKLREGKTSQLGNYAVVVEFEGEFGTMKEVCLCKPKRLNINAAQRSSSSR